MVDCFRMDLPLLQAVHRFIRLRGSTSTSAEVLGMLSTATAGVLVASQAKCSLLEARLQLSVVDQLTKLTMQLAGLVSSLASCHVAMWPPKLLVSLPYQGVTIPQLVIDHGQLLSRPGSPMNGGFSKNGKPQLIRIIQ